LPVVEEDEDSSDSDEVQSAPAPVLNVNNIQLESLSDDSFEIEAIKQQAMPRTSTISQMSPSQMSPSPMLYKMQGMNDIFEDEQSPDHQSFERQYFDAARDEETRPQTPRKDEMEESKEAPPKKKTAKRILNAAVIFGMKEDTKK